MAKVEKERIEEILAKFRRLKPEYQDLFLAYLDQITAEEKENK